MKVLWIIYDSIGKAAQLLNGSASQSGTWIDATADRLLATPAEVRLSIATIHHQSMKAVDPATGIVYYGVSGVRKSRGKRDSENARQVWASLLADARPDIIQIWGTEYTNGLDVAEAAGDIPLLVVIQGVMRAIDKYKYGNLSLSEIGRGVNALDKIKCIKLVMNHRAIHRQVAFEEQLVGRVKNVVLDNEWSGSQYSSVCPGLKPHRMILAVSQAFLKDRWEFCQATRNTVFCIAGRTPYKGLHQAIKALAIVKRQIPDIKLVIPGEMKPQGSALLTRSPYLAYLDSLIGKEGLQENIEFCGFLNPEEMARRMLGASAFVMPSCIENISSSLREAMYLGMPCISAVAGSIYELMAHGRNGLLYRYEEFEDLASHMVRVLSQPELAARLGSNAYSSVRDSYPQDSIGADLYRAYESILEQARAGSLPVSEKAFGTITRQES